MKWRRSIWLSVASGALVCGAIGGPGNTASPLQDYKKWGPLNKSPELMSLSVAIQCVLPSPKQQKSIDPKSPHKDYYLRVYANKLAKKQMAAERPQFPEGSAIVKEKLPGKTGEPVLLTAMIKREPGYDPEHGDWEYLVLDGKTLKIQAQGRLKPCQSCHDSQKSEGYVFRSYLPVDP